MRTNPVHLLLIAGTLFMATGSALAQQPAYPYFGGRPSPFSPAPASPVVAPPAAEGITFDELGDMLRSMNYKVTFYSDSKDAYRIEFTHEDVSAAMLFSLSPDCSTIWLKIILADENSVARNTYPWREMIAAHANTEPAMFSMWGGYLVMRHPVDNRLVSPAALKRRIDYLLQCVVNTKSLWSRPQAEAPRTQVVPPSLNDTSFAQQQAKSLLDSAEAHLARVLTAFRPVIDDIDAFVAGKPCPIDQLLRHRMETRAAVIELLNELEHMTAPSGTLEQQFSLEYKTNARWFISAMDELVDDSVRRIERVEAQSADSTERAEAQRAIGANFGQLPNLAAGRSGKLKAAKEKLVEHYHLVTAK